MSHGCQLVADHGPVERHWDRRRAVREGAAARPQRRLCSEAAARVLGISKRELWRRASHGLPHDYVAGRHWFCASEIVGWRDAVRDRVAVTDVSALLGATRHALQGCATWRVVREVGFATVDDLREISAWLDTR